MLNSQLSSEVVKAQAAAIVALLNNGYFNIYDGVQPKTADEAVSSQRLLVSLRFASPAAPSPVDGEIRFKSLESGTVQNQGRASWYRCLAQDGTTVIMDGSVGVTNANLILNNVDFLLTARVFVDSFVHKVEKANGSSS